MVLGSCPETPGRVGVQSFPVTFRHGRDFVAAPLNAGREKPQIMIRLDPETCLLTATAPCSGKKDARDD